MNRREFTKGSALILSGLGLNVNMDLLQSLFVRLPERTQDRLLNLVIRRGLLTHIPLFQMFMRTLEFMGADVGELNKAFSRAQDLGPSFIESLRFLGNEKRDRAKAADEAGGEAEARDLYFRAALYYLVADWATYDLQESLKNYELALPCFDRFRELNTPPIEKVEFPFENGTLKAHFRVPGKGDGPFLAIVIFQGNDTVKEWMYAFENFALERGMATLCVDQPGFGESGLSGNKLRSPHELKECSRIMVDFLQERKEIRGNAIGVFGVSLGGLLAPYSAGLEPRFSACAGIGGPLRLKKLARKGPAAQRRRGYNWSGAGSLEEVYDLVDRMKIEQTLSQARCPALVVHGDKDELVPVSDARALAAALQGETELKVIKGGDHLCTQFLKTQVVPYIFDWFTQHLNMV